MSKTKILMAIDDPDWAAAIAHTLLNFIDRENSQITILNVLETTSAEEEVFYANPEGFIEVEARKTNFAYVEDFFRENKVNFEFIFKEGDAAENILKTAAGIDADLIVLGSHNKKAFERIFLGSVAYKVSRGCKRPILITHSNKEVCDIKKGDEIKVLLAVDGSEPAYYAAEILPELIEMKRTNIDILNVRISPQKVLPPEAYRYADIDKIMEEALYVSENILKATAQRVEGAKQVKEVSVCGDITGSIIDYAKENKADLIVMGEHGKKGFSERILGSVSAKVSEKTQLPLLLIKKK